MVYIIGYLMASVALGSFSSVIQLLFNFPSVKGDTAPTTCNGKIVYQLIKGKVGVQRRFFLRRKGEIEDGAD